MAVTLIESPQKEKKVFSYRGYTIRKRESDGESRYDIINPKKDKKTPVWTDCGSVAEAKLWINSDIAGKSESLNEGRYDGKVSIQDLSEIRDRVDDLIEMMDDLGKSTIQSDPNTYGVNTPFIGTSSGYIDLSSPEKYLSEEDEDEDYEGESLKESSESGWTVKRFSFEAAIKGESASSLGLSAGGNGKFFEDLCKFLADHGMEMAGDFIDAEDDVTEIYVDNGYEFFEGSLREDFDEDETLLTDEVVEKIKKKIDSYDLTDLDDYLEDSFGDSEAFSEMKTPHQVSEGESAAEFFWDEGGFDDIVDEFGISTGPGSDIDIYDDKVVSLGQYFVSKHKDKFDDPDIRNKIKKVVKSNGSKEIDGFVGPDRLPVIAYFDEFSPLGFVVIYDKSRRSEYLRLKGNEEVVG